MSIYDIDYILQVKRLVPPKKRLLKTIAWLTSLVNPLIEFRNTVFNVYRPNIVERMAYNGQTIVLAAILNKAYAIDVAPFIYIANQVIDTDGTYAGTQGFENSYIGLQGYEQKYIGISYSLQSANFIVMVPVATSFVHSEMAAIIDKYRLFGTTYLIQTY